MTKIVEKNLKSNEIIPMIYDLMFTEIFNNEKNIVLLEEFISFYMNIPIEEVTGNLKLLKRNLNKKNLKSSKKEVDLLLDLKGKKYNIELSNKWNQSIKDRNVVYISHIHSDQLTRGFSDYSEIEESIQINLNNFDSEEDIKTSYYYRDETGKILSKKCRIDVINLVKGKKMSYTGDERTDRLIDWCKVFTSITEEELKKSSKKVLSNKSASKLVSEVRRLSGEDEIMIEFDRNSKRDLELKSEYDEMVLKFEKMYQKLDKEKEELDKERENLQKQLQEQLQEQLKDKDIQIKNKQIEIAKNLLKLNISIEDISISTGLTIEEIKSINT